MTFVIGHGRYARATYPTNPAVGAPPAGEVPRIAYGRASATPVGGFPAAGARTQLQSGALAPVTVELANPTVGNIIEFSWEMAWQVGWDTPPVFLRCEFRPIFSFAVAPTYPGDYLTQPQTIARFSGNGNAVGAGFFPTGQVSGQAAFVLATATTLITCSIDWLWTTTDTIATPLATGFNFGSVLRLQETPPTWGVTVPAESSLIAA